MLATNICYAHEGLFVRFLQRLTRASACSYADVVSRPSSISIVVDMLLALFQTPYVTSRVQTSVATYVTWEWMIGCRKRALLSEVQ